jgi:site-specific DNA-cytosine methylase
MRCCDHGDARATNVVALQDCEFPDKTQNGKGWRADGTSYTLTSMTTQGIAGALRIDSDVPQCESAPLAVDGRKRAAKKDVHRAQHVERDSSDAVAVGSSEVAGTLTASRGTGFRSNGTPIEGVAVLPMDVRRMTPREYEWLQGFPDGYTRVPYRGKLASDSPRYRALGNSMAVPVMHWLGRRIAAVFTPDNSRAHAADGECPPTTP